MSSFTCPNNMSLITGATPAVHGISGNFYLDGRGEAVPMTGPELLRAWGWFQGGFKPTSRTASGSAVCGASHIGSDGLPKGDYIPHHEPFQYWPQTVNPHHLPPSSVAAIGKTDQAHHQYDLQDLWSAVDAGHMPAVSYLKAAGFQDGHAGYGWLPVTAAAPGCAARPVPSTIFAVNSRAGGVRAGQPATASMCDRRRSVPHTALTKHRCDPPSCSG